MGAFDARTLSGLYEQHGDMVYRRALRMLGNCDDAREARQEVFLRVLRGADGFEQRSCLSTWLYRITTNYCLNSLRDRRRRHELLERRAPTRACETRSVLDACALRTLLARADPQQVQAAFYVFMDGMSHEEAAELLQVSRRTVGNLLERFQGWAHGELQDSP